jgi:hypothetical protein
LSNVSIQTQHLYESIISMPPAIKPWIKADNLEQINVKVTTEAKFINTIDAVSAGCQKLSVNRGFKKNPDGQIPSSHLWDDHDLREVGCRPICN